MKRTRTALVELLQSAWAMTDALGDSIGTATLSSVRVGDSGPIEREGRGEEVLVADDEPALRRVVAKVLSRAGYTVHLAADGEEAIKKIDELGARLDVVLSDVMMPGCSGYEVAEHASRVAPRAVVLLTSGFVEESTGRNRRHDLRILWKPVPPKDLVQAVAESLRSRTAPEAAPPAKAPPLPASIHHDRGGDG